VYRQFRLIETITEATGLTQYPFSATRRIEASAGIQRYAFKQKLDTFIVVNNQLRDRFSETLPGSVSFNLSTASTAFVGDSSVFGFISPINGTRYRYEIGTLQGDLKFQTALADWRKYFFFRPVTLAVRGLHYGRYGNGADDPRISPLYLGRDSIARGYDPYSINASECIAPARSTACPVFDRLVGSRIAAASVELRAPLLGISGYGLIDAPFLPTEIFAFGDVGAAWSSNCTPADPTNPSSPCLDDPRKLPLPRKVKLKWATNTAERVPVFSVGIGLRILLSYIPIEVFAAKPFQRPGEQVVYGFNIIPGW
jgi:outer membrane protein assembly factor BamA